MKIHFRDCRKKDNNPDKPITQQNKFPYLNFSIIHSIIIYTTLAQLGAFKDFRFDY